MTVDVFVSYSSKDKIIADTTVAALEQNQIRCWYAPRDIQSGKDWGKAITDTIDSSKVFLLIFSGNANQSQRVLDELNFAISKEIIILPFRIEKLEPDGAMGLHLSSRHWLDAYDPSWESHIGKLIKDVSVILETSIDEQQIVVPEHIEKKYKQQPKKLTRIVAWIVVGIFLITAGWYGWSWLNNRDSENPELSVLDTSPLQENLAVQASGTATAMSSSVILQTNQQTNCGTLKLDMISPPAVLENESKEYKLTGSGFCNDTTIFISGYALVGNSPQAANGQPVEVSSDGTWLNVYINPVPTPDQSGAYITVENPDGNTASLYVNYQR